MRYSYKKAIEELTSYALSEGYDEVIMGHDSTILVYDTNKEQGSMYIPRKLYIEGGQSLEVTAYLLLHELGHHELRKDWARFQRELPIVANAEFKQVYGKGLKFKRRVSYIVSMLEEEYMAWNEGLKLASEFGVRVNLGKWFELKARCVKTYIDYYK